MKYPLVSDNSGKSFYFTDPKPCCSGMKLNTLESIFNVLKNEDRKVEVDEEIRKRALISLDRMLELAE